MNAILHTLPSSSANSLSSTNSNSSAQSGGKRAARDKSQGRKSRRVARAKKSAPEAVLDASSQEFRDCLEQAEICHAQAQEAARLKRFKAAYGLFFTAITLCQRALGLREKSVATVAPVDTTVAPEKVEAQASADMAQNDAEAARAYLHELTIEMTTYSELARSMERPLRPNSAS